MRETEKERDTILIKAPIMGRIRGYPTVGARD
jgi:hypothetical protein